MPKALQTAIAIIPVRMTSQRLPGKPLAEIAGQSMVERVWRATKQCKSLREVYIATDSTQIAEEAKGFGAEVVMTSDTITTGSQRVAAAAAVLECSDTLVVNVQGDMPFINPALIDATVEKAQAFPEFGMVTAATPIVDEELFLSPSDVKVVVSSKDQALYFSRAPIPWSRDGERLTWENPSGERMSVYGFKHFGLYVFRPEALRFYESEEIQGIEAIEKLEQLRLLEQGVKVGVYLADTEMTKGSIEVDTDADLKMATEQAQKR